MTTDPTRPTTQTSLVRPWTAQTSRATPLTYARFEGASLRGTDLSRAIMTAANCINANFGGADLRFANLGRARLDGADLRNANLSFTNLAGANLSDAIYDESTIWRGTRYNQRTRWGDGERQRPPLR